MVRIGTYYWYKNPIVPIPYLFHKCRLDLGVGDGIVSLGGTVCNICEIETPKNIMFAYNLWKFHNG